MLSKISHNKLLSHYAYRWMELIASFGLELYRACSVWLLYCIRGGERSLLWGWKWHHRCSLFLLPLSWRNLFLGLMCRARQIARPGWKESMNDISKCFVNDPVQYKNKKNRTPFSPWSLSAISSFLELNYNNQRLKTWKSSFRWRRLGLRRNYYVCHILQ